jgi:hypothetical protein
MEGKAMFDKISRSWTLAGQCWDLLKEDPALLIFPLLSSVAIMLLLASFAVPVWTLHYNLPAAFAAGSTTHTARLLSFAGMYVFYVISYSIVMFFNTALIAVALQRLDGESASVREGLQAALSNLPAILGYELIAATVGTMLRAIEQRVGIIGRIVTAIIGAAWTLATAMTLPVLVVENVGPVEAISRSLDLLRKNWGENLIGNGGISIGDGGNRTTALRAGGLVHDIRPVDQGTGNDRAGGDCAAGDGCRYIAGERHAARDLYRGVVPLRNRQQG